MNRLAPASRSGDPWIWKREGREGGVVAVGPGHKKNRSRLHAFLRGGAVSHKTWENGFCGRNGGARAAPRPLDEWLLGQ